MPTITLSKLRRPDHIPVTVPELALHQTQLPRPDHALLIAAVISKASELDARVSELIIHILGARSNAALDMFATLSSKEKNAAFIAAARSALEPDQLQTYLDLNKIRKRADEHRNRFVHAIWKKYNDFPEYLMFVEPRDRYRHSIDTNIALKKRWDGDMEAVPSAPDDSKVVCYTTADIWEVVEAYRRLDFWYGCFHQAIHEVIKSEHNMLLPITMDPVFQAEIQGK